MLFADRHDEPAVPQTVRDVAAAIPPRQLLAEIHPTAGPDLHTAIGQAETALADAEAAWAAIHPRGHLFTAALAKDVTATAAGKPANNLAKLLAGAPAVFAQWHVAARSYQQQWHAGWADNPDLIAELETTLAAAVASLTAQLVDQTGQAYELRGQGSRGLASFEQAEDLLDRLRRTTSVSVWLAARGDQPWQPDVPVPLPRNVLAQRVALRAVHLGRPADFARHGVAAPAGWTEDRDTAGAIY